VKREDAEFICEVRADPERARYLHPIAPDPDAQRRWIEAYFDRPSDYYFMIESRDGQSPEGTVGIYNVNHRTAEWGRWIVRRGSNAALESAELLYRAAFETLGLESVYCRTISENRAVLEIHRRFGMEQVRTLPGYFELDGRLLDAVETRLTAEHWRTRHLQPA